MKLTVKENNYLGMGVSFIDNKVCFMKKALENEEVLAKEILSKKRYSIYEVEKVLKKSKDRIASFCPYSKECGGCTLDICSYDKQINIKENGLKKLFIKNNIEPNNFFILKNKYPLYYRNKISLKVENNKLGYYKSYTHDFISILSCPIAKERINNVIKDFELFSFLKGECIIRTNSNDEILLILKTDNEVKINEELFKKHKIVGIILNDKVLYGSPFLYERRDKLLYQYSYNAFFQVNSYISECIGKDILSFINKEDNVLDLYCGVGYFTLKLARKAKEVTGIEIVSNAVLNAMKNKKINHLENIFFHVGKVEDIIEKIPKEFTKVVIDPPRNGIDKKTTRILLEKEIPFIIYVSCNPETLVRDLKTFKEKYDIIFLKGYDMFSYTEHVECVCVLKLR